MLTTTKTILVPSTDSYIVTDSQGGDAFHALKSDWDSLWCSSPDSTQAQTWDWQYLYWKHLAPQTVPLFIIARDSRGMCVALGAFFCCRDQSSLITKAAFLGDKRPDYHLILARGRHSQFGWNGNS